MSHTEQPRDHSGLLAYPALTGFQVFEDVRSLNAPWEFGLSASRPMVLVELECGIERAQGKLSGSFFTKTDPTRSVTIMGSNSQLNGHANGRGTHRVLFVALGSDVQHHFPEYPLLDLQTRGNIKDDRLHRLCQRIRAAMNAHESLLAESLCCELTWQLIRCYSYWTTRNLPGKLKLTKAQLMTVLDRIEQHGLAKQTDTNAVTISSLAQGTNLSSHYFLSAFSNTLGVTPHQFIVRKRLSRARQLLADTSLSILRVADDCGFCSRSHFANSFRRATGMTPLRYRKTIQQAIARGK